MKNFLKILLVLFSTTIISEKSSGEEKTKIDTGHKYNIYTGKFDFSDEDFY